MRRPLRRPLLLALIVFGLGVAAGAPQRAAADLAPAARQSAEAPSCRLALILALDISNSVDPEEQKLQTQGLARALLDPEVQAAILAPGGAVSAMAFSWSGIRKQYRIAGWTLLDSEAAIAAFSQRIGERPPHRWGHPTALGRALAHAAWLHTQNPYDCGVRVIDVSGDGVNNEGLQPSAYRERGQLADLVINGLVIRNEDPDPLAYYIDEVIQGPGAFAIDIDSYGDYTDAMRRKLLRELSPFFAAAPRDKQVR